MSERVKAFTHKGNYMILNWANRITIVRILLLVPFVSCMLKTNDSTLSEVMRDVMRYISIVVFLTMAVMLYGCATTNGLFKEEGGVKYVNQERVFQVIGECQAFRNAVLL